MAPLQISEYHPQTLHSRQSIKGSTVQSLKQRDTVLSLFQPKTVGQFFFDHQAQHNQVLLKKKPTSINGLLYNVLQYFLIFLALPALPIVVTHTVYMSLSIVRMQKHKQETEKQKSNGRIFPLTETLTPMGFFLFNSGDMQLIENK